MTMAQTHRSIGCVESATKILGDKWTPALLRAIYNNEQVRFCQLQDGVGGINPRTLTSRLSRLEEQGIIEHCTGGNDRRECYRLTERGTALLPILRSMAQWGKEFSPTVPATGNTV